MLLKVLFEIGSTIGREVTEKISDIVVRVLSLVIHKVRMVEWDAHDQLSCRSQKIVESRYDHLRIIKVFQRLKANNGVEGAPWKSIGQGIKVSYNETPMLCTVVFLRIPNAVIGVVYSDVLIHWFQ